MRFCAIATDYDGTLAHDGSVDARTIDALGRVRESGRKLILVTGRQLADLFSTFPHANAFDLVVAENGALLCDPGTESVELLAAPAPPALVEALTRANVPLWVGRSIIATVRPHEHVVLQAIHDQWLDWEVIFNKDAVMALPSGVDKATGLAAALQRLDVRPQEVVGVGDAENDLAFLRMCGLSVAVSNALNDVKAAADVITAGAHGDGVRELIGRLLDGDLEAGAPARLA